MRLIRRNCFVCDEFVANVATNSSQLFPLRRIRRNFTIFHISLIFPWKQISKLKLNCDELVAIVATNFVAENIFATESFSSQICCDDFVGKKSNINSPLYCDEFVASFATKFFVATILSQLQRFLVVSRDIFFGSGLVQF